MARKTALSPSSTPRFDEAYKKLQQGVDKLRSSNLDNIDDLVPLVEETTKAYKECKERLEGVEKMLSQALGKSKD